MENNKKTNEKKPSSKGEKRVCRKGHTYYKSSDCPTCPVCENDKKAKDGFLSVLSAPAQRALAGKGIKTIRQLAKFSEAELLELHGFGPAAIPKLKAELKKAGLHFKK